MGITISDLTLPKRGVIIVKDSFLSSLPGLLEMNVIGQCWETLFQTGKSIPCYPNANEEGQFEWSQGIRLCHRRSRFSDARGRIGYVRLLNKHPLKISASSELVVWGRTKTGLDGRDYDCVIESVFKKGM